MFLPNQWPAYYSKAKGAEIWDLDGNSYIDMSYCGIGATVLGYADSDVDEAVRAAIDSGSMTTLNCPEEVQLAELLCTLHPWADMARYARCGGEAMAVAVRISRAATRRDRIAFCGYHGWHDWYLSANIAEQNGLDGHLLPGLRPLGVPRCLGGTAIPFRYNRVDELKTIIERYKGEVAAVVMEPIRNQEPQGCFLENVKDIARQAGAVLVFDEITAGWRLNTGGVHLKYDVIPDIAVFAKAMSNGYPMAAIIGRAETMQAAQDTFISSTYWTEKIGPVAALATIKKHKECNVADHLIRIGGAVQDGWKNAAERAGLAIEIHGMPPLGHFGFAGYEESQAMITLFVQMMLERGYLAKNSFYAMYAHRPEHVEGYLEKVADVFKEIARAQINGQVEALLKGPIAHAGFSRLT